MITYSNINELNESNVRELSNDQIESLLKRAEFEYSIANADQMAIKITINSMYGVFANKYFHFFSYAIASTITAQGRHITQSTIKMFNKYFREVWPTDVNLHKSLGITDVKPSSKDVVVYGDTDSVYFALDDIYKNVEGWKHKDDDNFGGAKFLLEIHEKRLSNYFKKFFDKYAEKFNTENLLDLEMEKTSRAGTFLAKKAYVLDNSMVDGIFYKKGEKFSFVGGELVKGKTPRYVKNKLKGMVKWLLEQDLNNFKTTILLKMISEIKEEYFLQDVDSIAQSIRISDYDKYVISEKTFVSTNSNGEKEEKVGITLKKGAPFQTKASAIYNHYLQVKYPKLKQKYPLIKNGTQIKFYHSDTKMKGFGRFGYLPNMFPYEFAPPIDKEKQFQESFIKIFNFYLKAVGIPAIDSNLHITKRLF